MITAQVVLDSVHKGNRLTTFDLYYPRMIHAELMTHRVFSRNASSSRAIPVRRLIAQVEHAPYIPKTWGKNKAGMQAGEELGEGERASCEAIWRRGLVHALDTARRLSEAGVHKQHVNRVLEPYSYIHVLVTSNQFHNWFNLRCHEDAQPEIQTLASRMALAYLDSKPRELAQGEWHTPFVGDLNPHKLPISAARCARVSYANHDGSNPDVDKDIALAQRLLESGHMSPFEHQARPLPPGYMQKGNLLGWQQFRGLQEKPLKPFHFDRKLLLEMSTLAD